MLTNPRDAFRGQSRSTNIIPFHMLDRVVFVGGSRGTSPSLDLTLEGRERGK